MDWDWIGVVISGWYEEESRLFLVGSYDGRQLQQLALGAGTGPGSCRAFPFRAAQVKFFWLDTFLFRLKLFRWTGTFVPQNCHVVTSMATVGRG